MIHSNYFWKNLKKISAKISFKNKLKNNNIEN